jgi:hypothetical protein
MTVPDMFCPIPGDAPLARSRPFGEAPFPEPAIAEPMGYFCVSQPQPWYKEIVLQKWGFVNCYREERKFSSRSRPFLRSLSAQA